MNEKGRITGYMKLKRQTLLWAGILAMSGILTASGCGTGNVEEKTRVEAEAESESAEFKPAMDTRAEAEIQVQGSWSNFEALEAAAEDWNKIYPNVMVIYSRIDGYYEHFDRVVTSENPPDIAMFDTDGDYQDKDNAVESLVDLSEIGLNTDIFDSGALDMSYYKGKMCALNWGMRIPGFVVNKTLLKNLGLEIPKTKEEFEKTCNTLVEKGYTPVQACSENAYKLLMENDRDYHIASEKDQEALYEKFSKAEAGCGEFFETEFSEMLDLVEKGYVSEEVNSSIEDIYEMSILHFFEGETPFLSFTTEGFSGMKKRESKSESFTEKPFEYEFVSLPVCEEEPVLSRAPISGLAVVKGSKNEKWAEEFLRFLCSDEELDKMASIKGIPAITKDGSDDKRFAEIDAIAPEKQINAASYPSISLTEDSFSSTLWKIACGDITDVKSAEENFEEELKAMNYS